MRHDWDAVRKGPVDSVAASELHSGVQAGHRTMASRSGGLEGGDVAPGAVGAERSPVGLGSWSRPDVLLSSRGFAAARRE